MAQLEARPVARISHVGGLARKRYVSTSKRRVQGTDLCNKVSVCNNDLLHAPIATQIAFCSGLHHNRPRDVKCYIGVGWIRLEAGGCFVAARLFSISSV